MEQPGFYATGPEEQAAINLFHGWGYNFYRAENQLRADDLMVRARVCELLGAARAGLAAAEAAFRRAHLPPPSRAHPLPDPQALAQARALESLGHELGALEGAIRALPVPETDRMTQRLRTERDTLERLLAADRAMVASARQLSLCAGAEPPANQAELTRHLAVLRHAVDSRRTLLQAPD